MNDSISLVPNINFRRRRAEALTAALMCEIDDVLPEYDREAVRARMLKVLHDNGAAWVTDEDRRAMGLEPRDGEGWTPSERVAARQRELQILMMQVEPIISLHPRRE